MSRERNMKWLNDRRIVYRRDPINDLPTIKTAHYKYYENGTHECYHLFNSKAKITTYKSLKWHFYVLYYLNMDNDFMEYTNHWFRILCKFIADKENGFVTFFISDKKLNEMIEDVLTNGGEPPVNKKRKIIFKDFCGLSFDQKMSIVGKLIGRSSRIDQEAIYQCMLDLNHLGKTITWNRVASLLNCSERTVIRKINNELKKEKDILNEEI